jgi:predicted dienelactone hydrolase
MKQFLAIISMILLLPISNLAQSYNVGEKTVVYTDSSRNRPIKAEVWYPTNEKDALGERKTDLPFILDATIRNATVINQKLPLIILSHGSGGNRFSLAWLAIALSRQGYMVASLDHWGGTFGNMIPKYYIRYWERPLDVSCLIAKLFTDSSMSSCIDKDKIGVIGYSFGGYTSLALAGADLDCNTLKRNSKTKQGKKEFNIPQLGDLTKIIDTIPCNEKEPGFKDDRIRAFIAFAPGLGLGYSNMEQCKHVKDPVLIIAAGNEDQVAPLSTNAQKYQTLITTSKLIVLDEKTGHYIFLNEGDTALKKEARQLFTDNKMINRKEIHGKITSEVLNFLSQALIK